MEFTDASFDAESQSVNDSRRLAQTFGTIIADDVSDLLPIILGDEALQRDISHYISDKNEAASDNSSDDEEPSGAGRGSAARKDDANLSDNASETGNEYAVLQDDASDEFGGFAEYSASADGSSYLSWVPSSDAHHSDLIESQAEHSDTNVLVFPNIPPLTTGDTSSDIKA
jgi:hypothetical protein